MSLGSATVLFVMPRQFQSGGPLGPRLSLAGLIQFVVRWRAAFWPVMMETRVGEHTLIAQKLLKRTPRAASRSIFGVR